MDQSFEYDYVFKVVFLGEGGVGKTSLILRYTQNTFTEDYKPTLGTDFAIKPIKVGDRNICLQIWDLAGQEHFASLRDLYCRGAAAGVLVYDVTRPETFMTIKNWYDAFQKSSVPITGSKKPGMIVLVGNKADMLEKRIVPPEVGEMFRKWLNLWYVETSAKSGENVEDVFQEIATILLQDVL